MKISTKRLPNGEWMAIDEDTYDGAPDAQNAIGLGSTREWAIRDLMIDLARDRVSEHFMDLCAEAAEAVADDTIGTLREIANPIPKDSWLPGSFFKRQAE